MRLRLAAIVLIGLPVAVAAQTRVPAPGSVPQLPPIGLPLPQIGLPLAPIGLPSTTAREPRGVDLPPRGIDNRQRRGHHNGHGRSNRSAVYLFPAYGWPYGFPALDSTAIADPGIDSQQYRELEARTGRLRLELEPTDVEVYIDGYYAGTPNDLGGEVEVEAGPHRVEIRAPGFETLERDVRITPGRSITFRGELKRAPDTATPDLSSQPPAAAVPPSKPVYFIPGCYLGNVPPKDVKLPGNCDMSRMTIFTQ